MPFSLSDHTPLSVAQKPIQIFMTLLFKSYGFDQFGRDMGEISTRITRSYEKSMFSLVCVDLNNYFYCYKRYIFSDKENPEFTSCVDGNILEVEKYDRLTLLTPKATDNVGIKSVKADQQVTIVTSDVNITWTASDFAGNQKQCVTRVVIKSKNKYYDFLV